jgi:hypothetical protein
LVVDRDVFLYLARVGVAVSAAIAHSLRNFVATDFSILSYL